MTTNKTPFLQKYKKYLILTGFLAVLVFNSYLFWGISVGVASYYVYKYCQKHPSINQVLTGVLTTVSLIVGFFGFGMVALASETIKGGGQTAVRTEIKKEEPKQAESKSEVKTKEQEASEIAKKDKEATAQKEINDEKETNFKKQSLELENAKKTIVELESQLKEARTTIKNFQTPSEAKPEKLAQKPDPIPIIITPPAQTTQTNITPTPKQETQPTQGYVEGTCKYLKTLGLARFQPGDANYTAKRDGDGDGIACE